MFANKSNTAKVGALVAVLVMCAAALAGSAYAYTATYVDTINEQPIEDVYLTINGAKTYDVNYGDMDLDAQYSSYTFSKTEGETTSTAIYYKTDGLYVNDSKVSDAVDNKYTYVEKIDTVTVKAFGDNATYTLDAKIKAAGASAFSATYNSTEFAANGISVYLVLQLSTAAAPTTASANTLSVADQAIDAGATKSYDLYVVVIIDQLGSDTEECPVDGETYYEAAKTLGNVTVKSFDVGFVATATQA